MVAKPTPVDGVIKMRLVIDEVHGGVTSYALPGGKYTHDAKKLAAAPVWFLDVGPPSNERQIARAAAGATPFAVIHSTPSTSSLLRRARNTAVILRVRPTGSQTARLG